MKKRIVNVLMLLATTSAFSQKTIEFTVEGMSCETCAETATKVLQFDGVISASVDFTTKSDRCGGGAHNGSRHQKECTSNPTLKRFCRGVIGEAPDGNGENRVGHSIPRRRAKRLTLKRSSAR